jgi:adenylate cyclase
MKFSIYQFDEFILDTSKRKLFCAGETVHLSTQAYEILLFLLKHQGEIVEKDTIISNVWNDSFVEENNLAVHISRIRKTLGEKKGENRFIETIPGKGYSFVLPIKQTDSSEVVKAIEQTANDFDKSNIDLSEIIAVLPFVFNGSNENLNEENLANQLTETFIINLSKLSNLRIISSSASFQYRNSRLDVQEICFQLGVKKCLIGNIYKKDNNYLVNLQLVNAITKEVIFGKTYSIDAEHIFQIRQETISEIVANLQIKPKVNIAFSSGRINQLDAESYRLFLQAKFIVENKFIREKKIEVLEEAVSMLQNLTNKYPDFSEAYSGIAYIYHLFASFSFMSIDVAMQKAKIYVEIALLFDNNNSEAYLVKGIIELVFEWNTANAKQSFIKSLQSNPNNSTAHLNLSLANLVCGDFKAALLNQHRASVLDPLGLKSHLMKCRILLFAREYEKAIAQAQDILDIDSRLPMPTSIIALAYALLGKYDESINYNEKLRKIYESEESLIQLANIYAVFDIKDKAILILEQVLQNSNESVLDFYDIALVYCALGETDSAFDFLERAIKNKSYNLSLVKVDPRADTIRKDKRFDSILRRINLS